VRREFSGLPVYVGVEDGYVYVKRTAPMDQRQFRRYLETCRRLGFRLDRRERGGSSRWRSYSHLQRYKPASTLTQPPQAGHPSWTSWRRRQPHTCADIGRRPAPTHTRPYAAQARRDRRSGGRERLGGEEAVYALRERGLVQYVREVEVVNWTGLLINSTYAPQSPTAKNGVPFRLFSLFSFFGAPKNGASILPNAV
jgi:hypothetical protein